MYLALNEVQGTQKWISHEPCPQGPNGVAEKADKQLPLVGASHFVNNFIFHFSQKSPHFFIMFIHFSLPFTLRLQNFLSYHLVPFFLTYFQSDFRMSTSHGLGMPWILLCVSLYVLSLTFWFWVWLETYLEIFRKFIHFTMYFRNSKILLIW